MGLIARAVEAAGIPTLVVGAYPDVFEIVKPPRAVWAKMPFGATFGEPGNVGKQQELLKSALAAFETMYERGSVWQLPFEWRRG